MRMKTPLLLVGAMWASLTLFGQDVPLCSQHHKHNEMMNRPGAAAQYAADQQSMKQREIEMVNSQTTRGTVYTIPVVFHVLHNGGIENISRAQILDAVAILNRDFRCLNADALLVHPDFAGMPADVEIEFVLASKAPDGTCFNGITRTQSEMTSEGEDGFGQVDAVVAGNDVYNGEWPGDRYLNIFVCQNIGGAAGYAYYPTDNEWIGTTMYNGIHVLSHYTGSIGTSGVGTSRTLTHEVGHWLNLMHVWGGDNEPMVGCGSDEVDDTPTTRGTSSCNLNENFCGERANVENYMDYAYCFKMFTPGQATRMRAALTSSVGGRENLWTVSNLAFTGVSEPILCAVEFATPITTICSGESIQFEDQSFNGISGWNWTFPGGTPATSTSQHPLIAYNTPGVYQVSLTATDGITSLTETKMSYIHVFGTAEGLPYYEGFEGINSFNGSTRWVVSNPGANNTWEVTTTAANSGSRSVKLGNYGQQSENIDELISGRVDLSGITSETEATLSFRYAYRKTTSTDDDYLKVFLMANCGGSWDQRKTLHGSALSNATVVAPWTPTSTDWITVHMTNVTAGYWEPNFRFKFHFESDGGNNIFLDDINIYSGEPSETVVVGVSEEDAPQAIEVFPNPADDELNVRFSLATAHTVQLTVVDLAGKVIHKQSIQAAEGTNLILLSTETLASGSYLIRFEGEGAPAALPFVVR